MQVCVCVASATARGGEGCVWCGVVARVRVRVRVRARVRFRVRFRIKDTHTPLHGLC